MELCFILNDKANIELFNKILKYLQQLEEINQAECLTVFEVFWVCTVQCDIYLSKRDL